VKISSALVCLFQVFRRFSGFSELIQSSAIFDFTIRVPNAPSVSLYGAAKPMKMKNKITTIEANPKSGDSTGSSSG
jgi:hypothetical protein